MRKLLLPTMIVSLVSLHAYGQNGWTEDALHTKTTTTEKVGIGLPPSYPLLYPLHLFAVLPAGGIQYGALFSVTSAASTTVDIQQAAEVELEAGYTGTGSTAALGFRNKAAGTGTSVDVSNYGNYGVFGVTTGNTTGDNAGAVGYAVNGQYNFGLVGNTMLAKSGSKNVGVLSYAFNNTDDVAIGGYFALASGTKRTSFTSSAALVADNGDLVNSAPIFLGRSGGATKFTIDKDGNVGIGTTATSTLLTVGPAEGIGTKVQVNGNIVATGTIVGAVYQDVAEWVPATMKMDPGTVVVLNPEHNNEVKPSEEAYDTRVAGVVSAKPGVLLGTGDDSKAMIATTGRVRVHVDATEHPVHIGDLLVTSSTAGTAMVSEPMEINGRKFHQPGTVIGKALEPLASGRGEILVLLSLQ